MDKLCITESSENVDNLFYVKDNLNELFSQTGCVSKIVSQSDRASIELECPEYYTEIIMAEVSDKLAEIIAIKYKYEFFKKQINIAGLSQKEMEILLTSLIAADLDEDKKYATSRFFGVKEIAVDGVFNFLLRPLKRKWQDVVSYMPNVFMGAQLKDFVLYLLENRKKRVYIDNGKVYDAHYRRLRRCNLLCGEEVKITREVLLSGGGEISLNGKIDEDDERYLKEFYGDKIVFSNIGLS